MAGHTCNRTGNVATHDTQRHLPCALSPFAQSKLRNYFAYSSSQRKLTKQQRTLIMSELPPSLRCALRLRGTAAVAGWAP